MLMPGRQYTATNYSYGFNNKEKDDEVAGTGNHYDYGMRAYDPMRCRFLSVDPLTKKYPGLTPYQFASNRVIEGIDWDGMEFRNYMEVGGAELPGDNNPVDEDLEQEQNVGLPGADEGGGVVNGKTTQANKPGLLENTGSNNKPAIEKTNNLTVEQNTENQSAKVNSSIKEEINPALKNRVRPRIATRKIVEEKAPKVADGRKIDPNTKQPIEPDREDLGHKPGKEWRRYQKDPTNQNKTRRQVIDDQNDPDIYQIEDRSSNRSHEFEQKGPILPSGGNAPVQRIGGPPQIDL